MNRNILFDYMEHRYRQKMEKSPSRDPGPVVTISRETGCPAKKLAAMIADKLNLRIQNLEKRIIWKCISKEILSESAKELNLKPDDIKYVFNYEERDAWGDIFSSFSSKYYKSDRRIRRTIADVIHTIAEQGHVIIIGRASVAITKDIPKSLHINLEAPLDWRIIMLSQKHNLTPEQAKKYAIETDKKREQFRNSFYGKNTDYTRFDVTYNCMTLTLNEISDNIIHLMELRKLI